MMKIMTIRERKFSLNDENDDCCAHAASKKDSHATNLKMISVPRYTLNKIEGKFNRCARVL